jgi:hypothetical protein
MLSLTSFDKWVMAVTTSLADVCFYETKWITFLVPKTKNFITSSLSTFLFLC